MVTHRRIYLRWLFQGLTASSLIYLLAITSSVECATSRTSTKCRDESTTIIVNETTLEWCAGWSTVYCWGTSSGCYCNVTNEVEKKHVTTICDDPTDASSSSQGKRDLTDPEVAAIAVISSLVFSILLSLTVFCVQRRCSVCRERKERAQVVQVETGREEFTEDDKFLASGDEKRYINVKPANRVENVYEEVHTRDAAVVLSAAAGSSHYYAVPKSSTQVSAPSTRAHVTPAKISNKAPPANRLSSDSMTQTEPCKLSDLGTNTSPRADSPRACSPGGSSPSPKHSAAGREEEPLVVESASSLKANDSGDYDELKLSDDL